MSEKKESKKRQAESEVEELDSSTQTNQPKKKIRQKTTNTPVKEQLSIKKRKLPPEEETITNDETDNLELEDRKSESSTTTTKQTGVGMQLINHSLKAEFLEIVDHDSIIRVQKYIKKLIAGGIGYNRNALISKQAEREINRKITLDRALSAEDKEDEQWKEWTDDEFFEVLLRNYPQNIGSDQYAPVEQLLKDNISLWKLDPFKERNVEILESKIYDDTYDFDKDPSNLAKARITQSIDRVLKQIEGPKQENRLTVNNYVIEHIKSNT